MLNTTAKLGERLYWVRDTNECNNRSENPNWSAVRWSSGSYEPRPPVSLMRYTLVEHASVTSPLVALRFANDPVNAASLASMKNIRLSIQDFYADVWKRVNWRHAFFLFCWNSLEMCGCHPVSTCEASFPALPLIFHKLVHATVSLTVPRT